MKYTDMMIAAAAFAAGCVCLGMVIIIVTIEFTGK